jgi:small subunit ribosomal protein S18
MSDPQTTQRDETTVNGTAPEAQVSDETVTTAAQTPEAQTAEAPSTEVPATEAPATEAPVAEDSATEAATETTTQAAPAAAKPATGVSLRDREESDDDGDDFDDDDDFDDAVDADDDDSNYVDGPAEYVQREKSGRARRIGSDIRVNDISYKNIPMLSRFLDRRGRILSRRKTKVSAKVQRSIVKAIKRARHLALLPYTGDHTRIVQKRGR